MIKEELLENIDEEDKEKQDLKNQIKDLENELLGLKILYAEQTRKYNDDKKRYAYYEARFVEVCKDCTDSDKTKCLMFPEYCDGTKCKQLVYLEYLIEQATKEGAIK